MVKNRFMSNLRSAVVPVRIQAVKACRAGRPGGKHLRVMADYIAGLTSMRDWVQGCKDIVRPLLPALTNVSGFLCKSCVQVQCNLLLTLGFQQTQIVPAMKGHLHRRFKSVVLREGRSMFSPLKVFPPPPLSPPPPPPHPPSLPKPSPPYRAKLRSRSCASKPHGAKTSQGQSFPIS